MTVQDNSLTEGCVVASGSLITKNVDIYTIVESLAANRIGERIKYLKYLLYCKMEFR